MIPSPRMESSAVETRNVTLGQIKAGKEAGLQEGQMIAYASIFDNVDSYGDVVVKGAFDATLKDWAERGKSKGQSIPFLYGHNMSDPNMNIGTVLEAVEDAKGLRIKVQFDEDDMAQKVYRLVKAGRLNELSFAFDVVKSAWIEDEDRPKALRELQEVKLYECSAVPIGANSETEVLAIKAAEAGLMAAAEGLKAGRSLSKKNEQSLREALDGLIVAKDALESVLPKAAEPDEDPDDEDEPTGDDPDEDTPDEDDEDKPKAGRVSSGVTHGKASGTGPSLGVDELDALLKERYGIEPLSETSPNPSAPVVDSTELELSLLNLSE